MSQTLENPYNRMENPKEYQKWYYKHVTKPKIELNKPPDTIKPHDYFRNRQRHTAKQLKFNRLTREELIYTIFIDHKDEALDPIALRTYTTGTGKNIKTHERTPAEAAQIAQNELHYAQKSVIIDPRAHRIIDFINILKKHPQFTTTEAFTLLELTFRYYLHRQDMPYYWIRPPDVTTDEELEQIIPKRQLLVAIPDAQDWYLRTVEENPQKYQATDPDPDQALWNSAKQALSQLKTDWDLATDEAQTYLHHPWTFKSQDGTQTKLLKV